MVLIGLLYNFFWTNLTKRKLPNQVIHVYKQDLLKIEAVNFEYSISVVDLNGSSNYLSKLKRLDIGISDGELDEVNIESLSSLEHLKLKAKSVKRIALKSLNALKMLFLYINNLESKLELKRDLCDQIPNIEQIYMNCSDLFTFIFYKFEKKLSIKKIMNDDFSSFGSVFNQIEKLSLTHYSNDNHLSKLFSVCDNFRSLLELNMCNCKVDKIDKKMFDGLTKLRSLKIKKSRNPQNVDCDAFSNLKHLVCLDLSSNRIESLDERTFSELVNLETLNLSGNNLISLDENIFSNLKNLRELDLGSNEFKFLDLRLFFGLENLNELNLSNYKLTCFDLGMLNYLPYLKKITLSGKLIYKDSKETEVLKRFKEGGIEFIFGSI